MKFKKKWISYLLLTCLTIPLAAPWLGISDTFLSLLVFTMINIILAQAINLLSGFAGIISIGQAGFYGIGGYASAILMMKVGLPFVLSLPLAVIISGLVGLGISISAGRVRNFYLAMLTLAFGLVVFNLLKQWEFVGSTNGIPSIPSPMMNNLYLLGIPLNENGYYILVLITLILVTWIINNVVKSYLGRSMMMMQQNEIAAKMLGISISYTRKFTFVVSAAITGLAGALYAHHITFLSPENADDMVSINILVYMVLGGWGNLVGPFLGAGFLTILPHQLQIFQEHQFLIYGIILFLSFLVFPNGMAGLLRLRTSFIKKRMIEKSNSQEQKINYSQNIMNIPNETLLEVKGITKQFGGVRALSTVDMKLKRGEMHGLIGPNGSGKTTMVNMITGIYDLTEGEIFFQDKSISKIKGHKRTPLGISRTFQSPQLSPNLTVLESVMIGGHVHFQSSPVQVMLSLSKAKQEEKKQIHQARKILEDLGLADIENELTGNLPYGIQRLVEIARALMSSPKLLILDEPAAGLSEMDMDELGQLLNRLKDSGLSILIIEHHMDFLLNLIDQVTVLDGGKKIYGGHVNGMKASKKVQDAYLGGAAI
jgi:branched-chain amino acid transport system permease protein